MEYIACSVVLRNIVRPPLRVLVGSSWNCPPRRHQYSWRPLNPVSSVNFFEVNIGLSVEITKLTFYPEG